MPDLGPFAIAGLSTGAVYVLAGVGLVVLYRASGVLNLAQGALGALSALLAWQIADSGGPQWVGWITAVAASTALALFYGRLIAPRLAHSDPIVRAVATLGFALIILGFCEFIWGEWPRSLRLPSDMVSFELIGVRVTATRAIAPSHWKSTARCAFRVPQRCRCSRASSANTSITPTANTRDFATPS